MLENRVTAPRAACVQYRAYSSGALRRHAMVHIIHYPTRISSAYRHKQSMPLPFDWNKNTLASQS